MNKTLVKNIFYVSFFLLSNISYFFVYFRFLSLGFTWLNFTFSLIGTLSLVLFSYLFKNKIWKVVFLLLLLGYYIWTLLNFAYFTIFHHFLDISTKQIGFFGNELTALIKEYYFLVPYQLYIFIGVILLGTLLFLFLGEKKTKVDLSIESIEKKENLKFVTIRRIVVCLLLFVVFNYSGYFLTSYYLENPREDWWQLSVQNCELGVWGNLYFQVVKNLSPSNYVLASQPKTELSVDDHIVSYEESSSLVKTKYFWNEMASLNNVTNSKTELPLFEEKPNILIFQLESVANWAVMNDPSPMPFLKSLIEENVTVPNFHSNSCETINAEFSSLCSFWPDSFEPVPYSHSQNDYNCLPTILKNKYNYQTYFFHANESSFWSRDVLAPKWGFDNLYFMPFFRLREYDGYVFSKALNVLSEDSQPWLSYIVSYTTHGPHNQDFMNYNKITNDIDMAPFSGDINDLSSDIVLNEEEARYYMGYLTATDNAIRDLFTQLEETGLISNTIVVIYNDHRLYGFSQDSLQNFNNWHQQPFVMVFPQKIKSSIQAQASHIDIAPTILNVVEQEKYQEQNNFLGQSLFSDNYSPQILNKCLGDIYYENPDLIIRGNASNYSFQIFEEKNKLDKEIRDKYVNLLKDLIVVSDQAIFSNGLVE